MATAIRVSSPTSRSSVLGPASNRNMVSVAAAASMATTAAVPPNGQQQLFDSVGQSAVLTL